MANLDKLAKVGDSFSVYKYDNGFMIEVGGSDDTDEWTTSKVLCSSIEELLQLIKEYNSKPLR
jgi:hypothetical protein